VEIEPPVREEWALPRCRCLVVNTEDSGQVDECPWLCSSPDSPLCIHCEAHHPQGFVGNGFRITMRGVEG
jgi:hypothetical protein